MKLDGRYRFTLQFPADTENRILAGELLERLGNKKSAVIVAALGEYIERHPELLNHPVRLNIETERGASRRDLEALVRRLVSEQLASISPPAQPSAPSSIDDDIARMLGNLDAFG